MGFDINSSSNKPVIRETASTHDGGAGNLGYFEQGGEHKEKKHKEDSIFSHEDEIDSFVKGHEEIEPEEDFSISKLIATVIFNIKEWFKKLVK